MSSFLFTMAMISIFSWLVAVSLIIFFFSALGQLDKKDKKIAARWTIAFIFWPSIILYGM